MQCRKWIAVADARHLCKYDDSPGAGKLDGAI